MEPFPRLDKNDHPEIQPFALKEVDRGGYLDLAGRIHGTGGRLVAVWGTWNPDFKGVFAAYCDGNNLVVARLELPEEQMSFPSVSFLFPSARRMERALRDLFGLDPEGLGDPRPWLDHGRWDLRPPLSGGPERVVPALKEDYGFIPVAGEGVHEIPVGPVHAGIIEPGHFRFQVVGEKILRMEERLGFTHKGIDGLYRGASWGKAVRVAGRVSGDTTVGHALAFSEAIEGALGVTLPLRSRWLRVLLLERERIANHLGDLGSLANDAGLAFGLAQFSRLKEDFFRENHATFGHRLLMDLVVPGGVARDINQGDAERLVRSASALETNVRILQSLFDEHGGLQDRFMGTGILAPHIASKWGVTGLIGRSSGQIADLRVLLKNYPYSALGVVPALETDGDVRSRVAVRFFELLESLRLERLLLEKMPEGPISTVLPDGHPGLEGVGWVEGWRGEILSWVRLAGGQTIAGAHSHDPSWILWPVLELAVPGNLVADFPLINKSFNLSYSGHDL